MKKCWLVVFGILISQFTYSQDTTSKSKNRYLPLGVPTLGSAPETGFYFGVVGLLDIIPRKDSIARHSVVKLELTYSLKKQFIIATDWLITNPEQTYMLMGDNSWLRFPELYWGIGGKTREKAGFLYSTNRLELSNAIYQQIESHWYAGIHQRLQALYETEFTLENLEKLNQFIPGKEGTISSGLGLGLLKDSRTNLLNPRPGEVFFSVDMLGFFNAIGSETEFGTVDIEGRSYQKVGKKSTLAFQAVLQLKEGDVPFRMMSLMGSESLMRGFYQGRFRDKNQLAAQLEYRLPIWRWFGMTAFGSAGNVFNWNTFQDSGSIKSAAGLGLRIRVDKKENTNMRFDFTYNSLSQTGFYVSFGEAF